jgi:Voltage gated chloride channel
MPLIALGSIVGLVVTLFLPLGRRESSLLAAASSFSAISALFGGPIVGGVMMVESGAAGLGAALAPALLPGFVAAAVGYVIFVGFGNWGGLGTPGLAEPGLPAYQGTHIYDLLVGVVVGVAAAVTITVVRRLAYHVAGAPRLGMPALLLGGGLAVGVLAELADLLGADSQDVLFSGQAAVPDLVAEDPTKIVLILLVAKALAYAVSLGCGFRGGPDLPGHLPRHRARDAAGGLVRRVADSRGRRGRRRGDGGDEPTPADVDAFCSPACRSARGRRGAGRRPGGVGRLAHRVRDRPAAAQLLSCLRFTSRPPLAWPPRGAPRP